MKGTIIYVSGSPNSGKTTFSLNLLSEISKRKNLVSYYVSDDCIIPALPYLFPNIKKEGIKSLGKVTDRPEILPEDILRETFTVNENFGILSYSFGENENTYPEITNSKVSGLFKSLTELADFILVDGSSYVKTLISSYAEKYSTYSLSFVTPGLKAISYFSSKEEEKEISSVNTFSYITIPDGSVNFPVEEVMKLPGFRKAFIIPYIREIKEKSLEGFSEIKDGRYKEIISETAGKILGEDIFENGKEKGKRK